MQTNSEQLNPSKKRLWLIIGCSLFVFLIVVGLFLRLYYFGGNNNQGNISAIDSNVDPCQSSQAASVCPRRAIDGVYVVPGQEDRYPIAVVIENQVDARPQAGIAQANLVYEVEVEGGITRFLAIFTSGDEIAKIGPVRSARPYLVDWAEEFSAVMAHCGGSPEALVKITQDNINDLNEFYNGDNFWRDDNRTAPHNIYTSSAKLSQYLDDNKLGQGSFLTWKFKNDMAIDARLDSNTIDIAYRAPDYTVEWRYDKNDNDYTRYLAGVPHLDESGQSIKAKNVIIETAKADVIDSELRLKMADLGSGKAVVCEDGTCQEGVWQKRTATSRTRFYKSDGSEFEFNAGTTWIEVVRPEIKVTY